MSFPNNDARESAISLIERNFDDAFIAARCCCTEADVVALREEVVAARAATGGETKQAVPAVDCLTEALTNFGTAHNKAGENAMNVMRFLDMRLGRDQLLDWLKECHGKDCEHLADILLRDFAILPRHVRKMTDEEIKEMNGG